MKISIMPTPLDAALLAQINAFDADKRFQYLITQVLAHQQIWILADEHGCMMLNTEDEDCVPVWPREEFAQAWAVDDWEKCKPKAISLADWLKRWTPGLLDDDLCLAIFPDKNGEGMILFPDELDAALRKKNTKR